MSDPKQRSVRNINPAPQFVPSLVQQGSAPAKAFVVILSVLALTFSGIGYSTVGRVGNSVASAGSLQLGDSTPVTEQRKDGAVDILLVGSDSRTDAQGNPLTPEEIAILHAGDEQADNTDTIMVIRIPNDGSSATAISIPRDTYIADPELGNTKINGVYLGYKTMKRSELLNRGVTDERRLLQESKEAGRQGLIQAISDLTGITVDHYAEIGLLGFVLLTDAVGGVDICLNDAVYDEFSGADFPAGVQTLNGSQGLAFVRQRHGLPRGDLDRIVRQQAFVASLVNKVLSTGTLTSPTKLSDLGEAVTRSVVIDDDWDIMGFATQLQNLAGGRVTFNTIPVTSIDGVGDHGESVVTIDPQEVREFFKTLLGDKEHPNPATSAAATSTVKSIPDVELHVLNASATTGLAAQVSAALAATGYQIVHTGNAQEGLYNRTQVLAADTSNREARKIAHLLGDVPVVAHAGLDETSIVIVTGADYAGPVEDAPITEKPSAETSPESTIGQPGTPLSEEHRSPVIDAGGTGPRCIN
ncbi:LCP family protein [Corynebacterium sp. HS2168-gen11]|uniref:LCP family protein n=1 Tax=Corynebacterium sp. HS2168-gen11 TaxID=2974027 RepID=UPI0037BE3896